LNKLFLIILGLCLYCSINAKTAIDSAKLNNTYSNMLTTYYQLKSSDPLKANDLLKKILLTYPDEAAVNKEMGNVLISQNQPVLALEFLEKAAKLDPNDKNLELQIAKIKQTLAKSTTVSVTQPIAGQTTKQSSPKPTLTPKDDMNTYYKLKAEHKLVKAQAVLNAILAKDPNNKEALLELGYLSIDQKKPEQALLAFEKAQAIDYDIVMQKAYLLDELKRYDEAYNQFQIASNSPDPKIVQESEDAMIYLAPETYKSLPSPWFVDFYFAPEYHSYFNDMIFPTQLRAGISLESATQTLELYGTVRGTIDTRSSSSGSGAANQLPTIYEDDTAIPGVGIRYYPYKPIPVALYAEVGEAFDLIDEGTERWNFDFRGGIDAYQGWGAQPVYAINPRFVIKQVGDFYGDVGYYTRYDHDIIGQLRVREGVRFFEWKNSSLDLYLKGEYFFDTNHEYFNNLVNYGPGLAFTPYNHLNLVIRVEPTLGYYIPVNSPDPNPNSSNYFDMIILAEFYIRI
jgi:tetratricopeptide (TPR) repeat protein